MKYQKKYSNDKEYKKSSYRRRRNRHLFLIQIANKENYVHVQFLLLRIFSRYDRSAGVAYSFPNYMSMCDFHQYFIEKLQPNTLYLASTCVEHILHSSKKYLLFEQLFKRSTTSKDVYSDKKRSYQLHQI